jgi:hypothetical protein
MLRKVLLGAILLVALAASPAAAQYSPTVVSPGTITPGGAVTASGQACMANQVVTITLQPVDRSRPPITVATVTADAKGNYSTTFVVPADLPLGTYMVGSSCGTGVAGKTIDVVAPNTGTTRPGVGTGGTGTGTGAGAGTRTGTGTGTGNAGNAGTSGSVGKLVRTGSDLDRMGLAGAGLLVAGGLLLVATKRRRHATGMAA